MFLIISKTRIEPCGLGSRIEDMESHTALSLWMEVTRTYLSYCGHTSNLIGPAKGFLRLLSNFFKNLFSIIHLLHAFLASHGYFWPPTASVRLEVKDNYVYVKMQEILNKILK